MERGGEREGGEKRKGKKDGKRRIDGRREMERERERGSEIWREQNPGQTPATPAHTYVCACSAYV